MFRPETRFECCKLPRPDLGIGTFGGPSPSLLVSCCEHKGQLKLMQHPKLVALAKFSQPYVERRVSPSYVKMFPQAQDKGFPNSAFLLPWNQGKMWTAREGGATKIGTPPLYCIRLG